MIPLLFGLLTGALVSFLATPLTISLAKRFHFVDDASTHKHPAILHTGIIPRAGGIPILLGISIGYLVLTQHVSKQIIGIGIGSIALIITGILDDRYDLSPYIRFLINVAIAVIVVGFGVGIAFVTNPFGGIIQLDQWVIAFALFGSVHKIIVLADILAVLWIVWMMNAINWSSGVDGQLSGIVAIGDAILWIAAWRFPANDHRQMPDVYLADATAAGFIGFLPWSTYPQKIMPGYSGAALGGFLLAVLAIFSGARLATALIVLGVPMADGVWAIMRRLSRKQSPFRGDREHFHHELLKKGVSKRAIALFYWITCAMLGIAALMLDSRGKLFAVILIAAVFGGLISWLRYLSTYSNPPDPDNG